MEAHLLSVKCCFFYYSTPPTFREIRLAVWGVGLKQYWLERESLLTARYMPGKQRMILASKG